MRKTTLMIGPVLAALAPAPTALAADAFPPLVRRPILQANLPGAPKVAVVKGATIRFAPGQSTGLHQHPMDTVGVVTVGEFLFNPRASRFATFPGAEASMKRATTTFRRSTNA